MTLDNIVRAVYAVFGVLSVHMLVLGLLSLRVPERRHDSIAA